ncbi:hypothetical protein D3C72_1910430 [compost metagenome]
MRRLHIGHQANGADAVLDGVEQCQPGEDTDGQFLFFRLQRSPGGNVVGERHFFRKPEIRGQAVPDFEILVVLDAVPVDRANAGRGFYGDVHCLVPQFRACRKRSPEPACLPAPSGANGCSRSS